MKGPVYRDTHEKQWALLLDLRNQISDYVSVLGLQVMADESEGYAFLRSLPVDDGVELPRLVARRVLPQPVPAAGLNRVRRGYERTRPLVPARSWSGYREMLQRAKGAIRRGLLTLSKAIGLEPLGMSRPSGLVA